MDNSGWTQPLSAHEREFLHELARQAITAAACRRPGPDPRALARELGCDPTPGLEARRGAFVTLHVRGRLRGCIGCLEGFVPLLEVVADNGRSAAISDPRFPPVTPDELASLDVEISVLTPMRPVAGPGNIEIGRHGIVLQKRGCKAVFLPQVAVEQGWDLPTTLAQLCRKAGLGMDEWREGVQLQVFEAEVF